MNMLINHFIIASRAYSQHLTLLPMGTSASTVAASSSTTASASSHDEIAFAMTVAEAAASVAAATAAVDDVVAKEEEEARDNEGAASNPAHNWGCSGVDDEELEGMAADGAIPLAWRSSFGDPTPTPI